jgi:hypothetical protein
MAMVSPAVVDVPASRTDPKPVGGGNRTAAAAEFYFSNDDSGRAHVAPKLRETVPGERHDIQETWPTLVFSYPSFLGLREHKLNPPGSLVTR